MGAQSAYYGLSHPSHLPSQHHPNAHAQQQPQEYHVQQQAAPVEHQQQQVTTTSFGRQPQPAPASQVSPAELSQQQAARAHQLVALEQQQQQQQHYQQQAGQRAQYHQTSLEQPEQQHSPPSTAYNLAAAVAAAAYSSTGGQQPGEANQCDPFNGGQQPSQLVSSYAKSQVAGGFQQRPFAGYNGRPFQAQAQEPAQFYQKASSPGSQLKVMSMSNQLDSRQVIGDTNSVDFIYGENSSKAACVEANEKIVYV